MSREIIQRKQAFNDMGVTDRKAGLSSAFVDTWLFGESTARAEQPPSHERSSSGPGELQPWVFFEADSACFSVARSAPVRQKPKIVISNAFLQERLLNDVEISLLSGLIKDYDVYLWEGDKTNLAAATPLSSIQDFLKKRARIVPAFRRHVEQCLKDQQLNINDWMVLDYMEYSLRCGSDPGVLDLCNAILTDDEDLERLRAGVDFNPQTLLPVHAFKMSADVSSRWSTSELIRFIFPGLSPDEVNAKEWADSVTVVMVARRDRKSVVGDPNPFGYLPKEGLTSIEDLELDEERYRGPFGATIQLTVTAQEIKQECRGLDSSTQAVVITVMDYRNGRDRSQAGLKIQLPDQVVKLALAEIPTEGEENGLPPPCVHIQTGKQLRYIHVLSEINSMLLDLSCSSKIKVCTPFGADRVFLDFKRIKQLDSRVAIGPYHLDKFAHLESSNPPSVEEVKSEVKSPAPPIRGLTVGQCAFSPKTTYSASVATAEYGLTRGAGEFHACIRQADGKLLPVREYRISVLDDIRWDLESDQLEFFQKKSSSVQVRSEIKLKPLSEAKLSSSRDRGILRADLPPGFSPLPMVGPVSLEQLRAVYYEIDEKGSSAAPPVEFHFDSGRQQWLVFVPGSKAVSVKLHYEFDTHSPYKYCDFARCASIQVDPLSAKLRCKLDSVIDGNQEIKFLRSSIDLREKLDRLSKFCAGFNGDTAFQDSQLEGTLNGVIDSIQRRCGKCIERAQAFMLLASWLKVPVRLVINANHAYCEIQTESGVWEKVEELGGSNRVLDKPGADCSLESEFALTRPAQLALESKLASAGSTSQPTPKLKADRSVSARRQEAEFRQYFTEPPRYEFKAPSEKPTLITLPKDVEIDTVRRRYFTDARLSKPYLFINSPKDFARYWQSYAQQDGKRMSVSGPLKALCEQGRSMTLLVNWSNFTDADLIEYQSLWGTPPQFHGQRLGSKPRVIGFIGHDRTVPESFASACERRILPEPVDSKSVASQADDQKAKHIRLTHSDWYRTLICNVVFQGDRQKFVPGALFSAIETKQSLVIHQPPNDSDLRALLLQLECGGCFWHNGQWVELPKGMSVSVSLDPLPRPELTAEGGQVIWARPSDVKPGAQFIHISRGNWGALFQRTQFDPKTGLAYTRPGLLELAAKQDPRPVFYITEPVDRDEWDDLVQLVDETYPGKALLFSAPSFLTPPGVGPLAQPQPLPPDAKTTSKVYVSNDTNYLVDRLLAEHKGARVIDMTPDLGITTLLQEIKLATGQADGVLKFSVQKKALLEALERDETVILNGPLGPELMQALLPLFFDPPYLEFNGERLEMKGKGRLLFVQSPKAAQNLSPLICPERRDFGPADYRAALIADAKVEESEKAAKIADALLLFFRVTQYPHRGTAMPKDQGVSFQRLVQMHRTLMSTPKDTKNHNVIKGFGWNEYGKEHSYYPFLNVVEKYLFDETTHLPMRLEKYRALRDKLESGELESTEGIWRLLNTCDGCTLRTLLGLDWLKAWKDNPEHLFDHPPKKELIKQLDALHAELRTSGEYKLKAPDPHRIMQKLYERVHHRLQNRKERERILLIRGRPGVGKSHLLSALKENKDYRTFDASSPEEFLHWLQAKPAPDDKRPIVLLWDEINTTSPGYLAMLDGLNRTPPEVSYKGISYPLSEAHVLLGVGNSEYFAGRHWHDSLRSAWSDEARLLDPAGQEAFLQERYRASPTLARALVNGALCFAQHKPLIGYSYRDLQNLMQRYQALKSHRSIGSESLTELELAHQALITEFGSGIDRSDIRASFDLALRGQLKLPRPDDQKPKLVHCAGRSFAPELSVAKEALQQALWIRDAIYQSEDKKEAPYKRGVLLEGDPGVGKTTLCEAMLREAGFAKGPDVPLGHPAGKCYYVATAGTDTFFETVKQAFKTGSVLLVENLHQLPEIEDRKLSDVLMGCCEGVTDARPGFLMLGMHTRGAANSHNRSGALLNRMHRVSIDPISKESWQLLAEHALRDPGKVFDFMEAAFSPQTPYPGHLTAHQLFEQLNRAKAQVSVALRFLDTARTQKVPSEAPPESSRIERNWCSVVTKAVQSIFMSS